MFGQAVWRALRWLLVVAGVAALLWRPPAQWVETAYANGAYPVWERTAFWIAHALPWSLGDLAVLAGAGLALWRIVRFARGPKSLRSAGSLLLDLAAIAGLYALWFNLSWGWNYARAPLESRVAYDPSRVTPQTADSLRERAIREINALAGPAHARASSPLDLVALYDAWLPAVQRAGDRWTPLTAPPKPTIADPFMQATGTSGFINPLTLNVHLAGDVLWFERPFDLAHEWSHDAAYAREDEANYLAIVTALRSPDPAIRYSGWFQLFLYLPQKPHYQRSEFDPLVWQDFAALRKRDARHINALLARWTWRTYGAYLKSNRIASGVQNYNEVTRLILGIPLDADGLPVAR